MKILLIVFTLFILQACTSEKIIHEYETDSKSISVKENIDFEGAYIFKNGSFIELIVAGDGEINISQTNQVITSTNPFSDTLASHPKIAGDGLELVQGKLYITKDITYNLTQGIEEDNSNTLISGRRRTDFIFEKLENDRLKLVIRIYEKSIFGGINSIKAIRILKSL